MTTQRGSLLDILKCCSCNEIPWSQVFQCANAHIICDKCQPKVNNCPKCKIKLEQGIQIRSSFELILDSMEFDCPYLEQGCKERLTRNKMSSHREKCGYGPRLVQLCKKFRLSCECSVSSNKIQEAIDHFLDVHEFSKIDNSNEFTIALERIVSPGYLSSPQDLIFSQAIVKLGVEHDSPVFLIVGIVKEKLLRMVSLYFGDCTPSYRCEFEIDMNHRDLAAKLSWTERPNGIWSKDFFDLNGAVSVTVPLQVLRPYGTSNGSILVNVTIVGCEENVEIPQTQIQSPVVTDELNLQQEHSPGNKNTDTAGDITETGEAWKAAENPFLIKSVVKNICKYLSFPELKLCRGLSSLWKEATDEFFLKLCPQLILSPGLGDRFNVFISKRKLTISEFMKIYSDSDHSHPLAHLLRRYRKFRVSELTYHKLEIDKEIAEFYDFLTKVGPQMTLLELKNLRVLRNLQDCVDIFSCKYTTNLESLFLYQLKMIENYDHQSTPGLIHVNAQKINTKLRRLIVSFRGGPNNDLFQIEEIPWLDVLSRFPKLKVLCLDHFPSEVFEKIATSLITIRQTDGGNLNLRELDYSRDRQSLRCPTAQMTRTAFYTTAEERTWERIRDLLKNSNLPLVKLDLYLIPEDVVPGLLDDFSKTLKSLKLYFKIPEPFPLMHTLKEVALYSCSDLKFLSSVPNLVSLCFKPSYCSGISFPEIFNPIMSLTKFQSGYRTDDVAQLEQLFSWMPNIRVLEMWFNNNTFSWVCQHLPNLKELIVFGENVDDSGVVGDFQGTTAEEGFCPNITNLRELETFQMKGCKKLGLGLTEKSVFQGFCLMNKLTTLVITVKSQLSEAAMNALEQRIENVQANIA